MKVSVHTLLALFGLLGVLASCKSYKQNIMFKVSDNTALSHLVKEAEKNYVIQKNDYLKLEVYTNGGERIIDPELKLLKDMPNQNSMNQPDPAYLVNVLGLAKLPMVGEIKLEYTNKRVFVLGSPGGKVIPLVNENVTMIEIIALATGIENDAMAHNIRVIRGEEVFVVDFSTIEGYKKGNMIMQHGDIVYVEPIRRPVAEATRDYAPLLSLMISITTLIVVLVGL